MQYARAAYGINPHAGVNPNDDHGWGGYQWPEGVPASLLATLTFNGRLGAVTVVGRKELMPLVGTLMRITEEKYGYYFHPGWCWSYENRSVTGSTTVASNHSRAKAFDWNSPNNPYSWTWQADIPPAVVALWEAHGFYWGGRYTGQPTDPMHFEYCESPATVAAHLASAQAILGGSAGEAPNPVPATPAGDPNITAPGVTVAQVQTALNAHGAQLVVDNDWGQLTQAAVADFQRSSGLEPDGIVGPLTWAALTQEDTLKLDKEDQEWISDTIDARIRVMLLQRELTVTSADGEASRMRIPDILVRNNRLTELLWANKAPSVAQIAAAIKTAPAGASPEVIADLIVKAIGKELAS